MKVSCSQITAFTHLKFDCVPADIDSGKTCVKSNVLGASLCKRAIQVTLGIHRSAWKNFADRNVRSPHEKIAVFLRLSEMDLDSSMKLAFAFTVLWKYIFKNNCNPLIKVGWSKDDEDSHDGVESSSFIPTWSDSLDVSNNSKFEDYQEFIKIKIRII